jgi:hypothetical protein
VSIVETARWLLKDVGFDPTDADLAVIEANERLFGDARRMLLTADFSDLPIEEAPDFSRPPVA